jgi:hypothetical protein
MRPAVYHKGYRFDGYADANKTGPSDVPERHHRNVVAKLWLTSVMRTDL